MSKKRSGRGQLKVVAQKSEPVVTVAQLKAMEFKASKRFAGLSQWERLTQVHKWLDHMRAMAVLAAECNAFDKDDLIERTREKYDTIGPMLMQFSKAADDARELVNLLQSAECRMAVALAHIEGDHCEETA